MKEFAKEWLPYIIIALTIILLRTYVITPVIVKGDSMFPNFIDKEILFLSKISYRNKEIKRFDVVVVNTDNDLIIKRVIGLPGEKVEYKDNKLYINDELVEDIYGSSETADFDTEDICEIRKDNCTTIIPKNKYLVLGDNREISADSRVKGFFTKEEIKGKIVFRLWPFNKLGKIEQ